MATDCIAGYMIVQLATVYLLLQLLYVCNTDVYSNRVRMYQCSLMLYIAMCQMIGPCIFTDYTLDVAGYLIFLGLLLSCDYMLI